MQKAHTYTDTLAARTYTKWEDYKLLVKVKLSSVVVITSMLAYAVAAGSSFSWYALCLLAIGGFAVTAAANAINQVLEKDFDKYMTRTANRPVTAGRMKTSEAVMFAGIACLIGITVLSVFSPVTAFLGMLSFVMYAFVYTPMKRYSTLAVAVGAIPGALPVLIGATAATGSITLFAVGLFLIQFLWQFPHFWAIGFLAFDDYSNAGYKLLPASDEGIDRNLGIHSVVYSLLIVPLVALLYYACDASIAASVVAIVSTVVYAAYSFQFHRQFDRVSARSLMFCSFFYMPIVLIAYLIF